MKHFRIFQNTWSQSKSLRNAVNEHGWDKAAENFGRIAAHLAVAHDSKPWNSKYSSSYSHVANMLAEDLEHCFRIGNGMAVNGGIQHLQKMHSLSVGDIVHDQVEGVYYLCRPEGWNEINFRGELFEDEYPWEMFSEEDSANDPF